LYKSVNGGKSWRQIGSPNPFVGIEGIAVDPKRGQTIYAGSDDGCTGCDLTGLFKSLDGGRSWQVSQAYLEGSGSLVLIHPANTQHLFADGDPGFETSTNGGKTWHRTPRQPHGGVFALALDPLNPQILFVGTDTGLVKSTDAGRSWQRADSGLPKKSLVSALAVEPDQLHTILAVVSSGTRNGVFKSADGGRTWQQLDWQLH
jgi:photosystem II stability/assembly factor-like uncharacterized protein